jgi:hypothetical protein
MSINKILILTLSTVLMAACGSSSNSNDNVPSTLTQTVPDRPLADYGFSDEERDELLVERNQALNSISVNFQGKTYNQVEFSAKPSETQTVLKLASADQSTLYLLISDEDEGQCLVYRVGDIQDAFECDDASRSTSGEQTLIESTTENGGLPI